MPPASCTHTLKLYFHKSSHLVAQVYITERSGSSSCSDRRTHGQKDSQHSATQLLYITKKQTYCLFIHHIYIYSSLTSVGRQCCACQCLLLKTHLCASAACGPLQQIQDVWRQSSHTCAQHLYPVSCLLMYVPCCTILSLHPTQPGLALFGAGRVSGRGQ